MTAVLPNTLIIGAMKASTTTLWTLLGRHADVWLPAEKEPTYFSRADWMNSAVRERYLRLFRGCPAGTPVVVEASTNYSKLPHFGETPDRIRAMLGRPRLVYLLRDPVARTISNFQHSKLNGDYPEGLTCLEALTRDPIIVDASCYARQLLAYRRVFGEDAVHVILAEQLHANRVAVMRRLADYLEIRDEPAWARPVDAVNAIGQLSASRRIDRWVGPAGRRRLGQLVPRSLRGRVKGLVGGASRPGEVPEGTGELILERIEEDLRCLHGLLGDAIAIWPSARRLLGLPVPEKAGEAVDR